MTKNKNVCVSRDVTIEGLVLQMRTKENVMTMMEGQRFKSTLTRLGRACYCSGQSRPAIGPLPCTGDLLRGPGLSP